MTEPRILLLDGCSGSGKSSFKNALLSDERFTFQYVKRYTTRVRRPDDIGNDDYHFVSQETFNHMVVTNQLAEYRRYLFGMAYGLRTADVMDALQEGKNALGLMNLGAVDMARSSLPEASIVLIDTPIEDIEARLRARNYHSEEQIRERLENARTVNSFRNKYDYVCQNRNGFFATAYEGLVKFLELA